MSSSSPLFLGLDLSTQGLKAILIDEESSVVGEHSVHFDKDLPHFGTTNGAIRGPAEGEVTSPVQMWLEALDLLMERMKTAGVEFSNIVSISGDGQQHGSVYWSPPAASLLSSLSSSEPLAPQLCPAAFSFQRSPIWQDSSTTRECRELEEKVGGKQALAELTGSRAYERFTGNQIMRIRRVYPEAYAGTSHISLVSSFLPSLFLQFFAPIEVSDASGMNLMDIITNKWDDKLLELCGGNAQDLRQKLGEEPVRGGTVLGTVGQWWVERWGFPKECIISPFTGDNPATVMALSTPGDGILSLGTSTTLLLSIPPSSTPPGRFTTSHILAHPTTEDSYIAMLCYKNGALERDRVRDRFAEGKWEVFDRMVQEERERREAVGRHDEEWLGFYFGLREIIPPGVQGEFFFKIPVVSSSPPPVFPSIPELEYGKPTSIPIAAFPQTLHPLSILRTQLLSILSRIHQILPANSPPLNRLILSGGGSANACIRQLAADIFGMDVYVPESREAAAKGGAVLARYAWWREKERGGMGGTFEEMVAGMNEGVKRVAVPKEGKPMFYEGMVGVYRECEDMVVRFCEEKEGGELVG